ncbi:hypothetical protein CVT24_001529, partial [Panaeolus cyanescens]
ATFDAGTTEASEREELIILSRSSFEEARINPSGQESSAFIDSYIHDAPTTSTVNDSGPPTNVIAFEQSSAAQIGAMPITDHNLTTDAEGTEPHQRAARKIVLKLQSSRSTGRLSHDATTLKAKRMHDIDISQPELSRIQDLAPARLLVVIIMVLSVDDNPRPSKRTRFSSSSDDMAPLSVPEASTRLPQSMLLLSLPTLLQHPPGHKHHSRSLFLSLFALRKCLSSGGLDVNAECRAWTDLAELGFRIGLHEPGIENEIEKAITKATLIASKHPTLNVYQPRIMRLSARLALHQGKPKLASTSLKRDIASFSTSNNQPHDLYASHLEYITSLTAGSTCVSSGDASIKPLSAIRDLYDLATHNKHGNVSRLALVLELRQLMHYGQWTRFASALQRAEQAHDLVFSASSEVQVDKQPETELKADRDAMKVLQIHVLMFGLIFYTHVGDGDATQPRMKKLHDMLDSGDLDAFGPFGVVDLPLADSPPLQVQVTHPRIVINLAFLLSSVSKRDPVGRKPKRKLFAGEGIQALERDIKREIEMPIWASQSDLDEMYQRMHKIRADMICELAGVSICRSEFSDAEKHLSELIAFTRSHNLFSTYCARITLHQAHLAHALGNTERALKCYRVAAYLSRPRTGMSAGEKKEDEGYDDPFVYTSARAGEIWLRIGCLCDIVDEEQRHQEFQILKTMSSGIVKTTEGLGGTLQAIGCVIGACLTDEFLQAKSYLRTALNLCTASQDNHLRPLILSLIAGQYLHTAPEHTQTMLATADQLAAGLGAQPKALSSSDKTPTKNATPKPVSKSKKPDLSDGIGNAYLRLWIGERNLELKKRAGDEAAVAQQAYVNEKLRGAVERVRRRAARSSFGGIGGGLETPTKR